VVVAYLGELGPGDDAMADNVGMVEHPRHVIFARCDTLVEVGEERPEQQIAVRRLDMVQVTTTLTTPSTRCFDISPEPQGPHKSPQGQKPHTSLAPTIT
jgi:hypothetical protein